ncbi:4594_t:CDS:2 [Dentiscutata erythropus]|uniref:4594_t:CDS:1 n=1 Tax=Dentiscutata erythropus TaxID=1348616 RepID=A0A9N9IJX0_9GLOM|nr:4594_t:CDS:2 [Dentiscutata erythropus]
MISIVSTSKKTDADNNKNEDTFSEANWDDIINKCEEQLIKEEFEEEQNNLDNADTDFFNSEIHLAKN